MTKIEVGKKYRFSVLWSISNNSTVLKQTYKAKYIFLHYRDGKEVKNVIHHESRKQIFTYVTGYVQEIKHGDHCTAIILKNEKIEFSI
jgi:hypothetical protein